MSATHLDFRDQSVDLSLDDASVGVDLDGGRGLALRCRHRRVSDPAAEATALEQHDAVGTVVERRVMEQHRVRLIEQIEVEALAAVDGFAHVVERRRVRRDDVHDCATGLDCARAGQANAFGRQLERRDEPRCRLAGCARQMSPSSAGAQMSNTPSTRASCTSQ